MIKKLLTYTVAITTIVWSVGLLALPLSVGAAVSGDLIKLQCATGAGVNDPCKAVYYLGADGKRYVFPNEKTYKTWYADFSGVQIVSATELSSYSIGGNATYRPGVKLVKITTDPKVYAVGGNGTLHWVTTAAIAESLYGASWASTSVEDVSDAFFVNYLVGSDINAASEYDKASEMDGASTINEDKNLGGATSSGTGLTAALAADTPASGIVVGNSINNKFTKVDFTASADGDIVIDQVVIRRGGTIASDSPFSSVALIDAATNIRIGTTKTLNSEHKAVFNKDITVSAGTTKSIYLAGNMGATALYAGEIPSLDLYSVTLLGSASVIGTLPIVGNYQNINGTVTIGALTLANGANNPDASTQKIGTTNYIISSFKLTANSVEDFKISQVQFNEGGTADNNDVGNLDLLVEDVVVATVAFPSDGDVFFNLSASPILIEKGKSKNFDLQLDINDGSARTIRFDVKDESDVVAKGQLYGSEVKVSAGTGATADAEPFWVAPITTIDIGALRIGPATLEAVNIPEDVDQVVLGKFEFEAKGEPVEITSLPIGFIVATSGGDLLADAAADITNVTLYDEDNKIVAGPLDPTVKQYYGGSTLLAATTTDTVTVPTGVHKYTVKADLDADFGTDDTIVVHIKPNQLTAKGETTGLATTPTPATEQSSATMTVKGAALSMSVSSQPIAQTVVAGTENHTFANVVLGAQSSGEDIKVTKVAVAVKCNGSCNPAEVSNWSIFDGATELSTTNDPDSQTSTKVTDGNDATSTFLFTTPLVIAKGTSKTLTVKGTISTAATNGTMNVGMSDVTTANHITAKGNNTALDATVTLSRSDGQGQTFISGGTLDITQDSSTPDAGYIPANSSGLIAAVIKAQARYEEVKIESLYVTGVAINSGGWDQVDKLYLYKGSALVASVIPTSTDGTNLTALIDITNTPIVVPKDGTVALTFKIDTPALNYELNGDGSGLPSSLQGIQLSINSNTDVTAKGVSSGSTISSSSLSVSSANGNNMYLVKSFPIITLTETSGTFPAATNIKDLHLFKVTADSTGDLGSFQVSYEVTTATATVTDPFLYEGSTKLATASTTVITHGDLSGNKSNMKFVLTTDGLELLNGPIANGSNALPAESVIQAGQSRTYTFKATIECKPSNCLGSANTGTVIVKFLGDNAQVGTAPVTARASTMTMGTVGTNSGFLYERSMLWTDWWRTPTFQRSSTTASNTEQWINAYLVTDQLGNNLQNTSSGSIWSKSAQ